MGFWDAVADVANPAGYIAGQLFGGNARDQLNSATGVGALTDKFYQNAGNIGKKEPEAPAAPSGANADARYADIEAGNTAGRKEFYEDPEMQALKKKREELAKGYSGTEYGALRENARAESAGQRQSYLDSLRGKLARAGVGGARGAAVQGAADQKYAGQRAEQERKLALDSANLQRQGQSDLQDFIFRQKYGTLGTGLSYGQLGAQDRGSAAALAAANAKGDKGILGNLLTGIL